MLEIITQIYSECGASMLYSRYTKQIQEVLVAPLSAAEIVTAFIAASVVRSTLITTLILAASFALVHVLPVNWPLFIGAIFVITVLFGAFGYIIGLFAETYNHVSAGITFVLTPLIFVSGIFAPLSFLPPGVRRYALLNPMVYLIDTLRGAFTNSSDIPIGIAMGITTFLAILTLAVAYILTRRGFRLRT